MKGKPDLWEITASFYRKWIIGVREGFVVK
jgi:hypothetical protein